MDDMLKDFVVEALELAVDVEERLLQLERGPNNPETLNAVFRSFHTIKGGAGFMNLMGMVSACHLTENLFDALRTGKTAVTPLAIEAALQASGFVADLLNQLHNGASPESLAPMPEALDRILTDAIEGRQPAVAAMAMPLCAAVASVVADSEGDAVDWVAMYNAVVPAPNRIVAPSQSSAAPAVAPPQNWDGAERRNAPTEVRTPEDSIRVDAVKLDALLEVAGESVQAANQAAVLLEKLQQFKFDGPAAALMATLSETLGRASRYATELQRATLATRMQPVGRLFQKFPRLVRELARDLGKEVELVIEGAETEVDRVVVDSLYDPLVHMLRNSLDHGIENTDERLAAGKPASSRIMLKAWQEANSVMIVISDDGRGMDPLRLRAKAVANGLIAESATLTPTEAYQLVFLPGFSTKEVASSVSGRGVGMDVVKTAVEKHRGVISIDSTLGTGTQFAIRLPIELSIVPTMLVNAAGAALGMPLALVERVVELPEEFMHVGGFPVLRDQGQTLPVRSLAASLGYAPGEERMGIVVAAPSPYVLSVGAVDGTADLVIKPLTALSAPGITGTSRSAEGELVLVVGLSFLLGGCH